MAIIFEMYIAIGKFLLLHIRQFPVLEIAAGHWNNFNNWPTKIQVGQIYCTFSMGWQSITYKMSDFQKTADQFLTFVSTIDVCTYSYTIYGRSNKIYAQA